MGRNTIRSHVRKMPDAPAGSEPGNRWTRWYRRHEKWAALAFFVGGVGYDFLTLTRIDRLLDNLILFAYLLLLGALVVTAGRLRLGRPVPDIVTRHRALVPLAIQFLLGSLFSAYTVYYFASVSLTGTAVFFVLLVCLLVANERLAGRLENPFLLMGMFCFASFSFFAFFVPVLLGAVNRWTFALSTVASAALCTVVLLGVHGLRPSGTRSALSREAAPAAGLLGLLILLHAANWIPPVPLALRFGGIYHEVRKEGAAYHLTYARPPWYRWYAHSEDPFLLRSGDRVYCFASVFAPIRMRATVYHRWQRYDERQGRWEEAGRMGYGVAGGRDGGYRGFTWKQAVAPGRWRVDVETEDGQLLGRVRFRIAEAGEEPLDLAVFVHR